MERGTHPTKATEALSTTKYRCKLSSKLIHSFVTQSLMHGAKSKMGDRRLDQGIGDVREETLARASVCKSRTWALCTLLSRFGATVHCITVSILLKTQQQRPDEPDSVTVRAHHEFTTIRALVVQCVDKVTGCGCRLLQRTFDQWVIVMGLRLGCADLIR